MNKIQAMELASGLTRLITGMEDELLQNIAAYLLAGKVDSSTSKWKIRKLAELGKLHQKNIETITSYAKEQRELAELTVKLAAVDAMQDTERGFRKAVIAGLVTDAADGTVDSTMNAIIGTLMKQAKNDLNIVNTTMLYKARDAAGKAVRDAAQLASKQEFVDMLNKAAGQVVTNTETMTAAVSKCLKDMANKGIPAFVDRGGREWSPEAYVGLCVRQTAMNTGTTALFERMKDYHTHFIEISSHLGARPKCSRDQGRIFDLDNTSGYIEDGRGNTIEYSPWSSSSYGQPDGILGINCKHSAFPFTPGNSLQTYFPYDKEENDKRYKEIQKQRELERNVRAAKRECAMLKNGDPEEFKKASVRLKERTAQLKQYCTDHDLTYMNERTSVIGYGHSEASKVTAAYKKTLQNEQLTLDKIAKGDIMDSENSDIIRNLSLGQTRKKTIEDFENGLSNMKNRDVASVLDKAHKDVKYGKSKDMGCHFKANKNKITLSEVCEPSDVAHELFHKIDHDNSIVSGKWLDTCVSNDFERIKTKAQMSGMSISDVLYCNYPDAFESQGRLKKEYRGISDIINGMTKGTVDLGYRHDNSYWKKDKHRLQNETFAQYGRMYFEENEEVIKMASDIFPDTTKQINDILSVIISFGR